MLRVAVSYLLGCLLGSLVLWPPAIIPVILSALIVAGFIFERKECLCIAIGLCVASLTVSQRLDNRLDRKLDGDVVEVTGAIASLPRALPGAQRFRFRPILARDGPRLPSELLVSWYRNEQEPAAGEIWRLNLRLRAPRGGVNPGTFDYEGWLFRQNIGATAYVDNQADNRKLSLDGSWPGRWLRFRSAMATSLIKHAADPRWHGLINGLAVGDRRLIDETQWEILRATGTAHLMAISGLHVGMAAAAGGVLGAGLWMITPFFYRRVAIRDLSVPAGVLLALAYALLAGLTLPTQRALVMLFSAALAVWWRRSAGAGHGIGLALLGVLLLDPLAGIEPGFWLSFAAVASLIMVFAGRVADANRWARWYRNLLRAQGAVYIGLLPVGLAVFSLSAPAALLANLLFIPLFSLLCVPLILMSVVSVLAGFEWLAVHALNLTGDIFNASWPLLEWLAQNIPPITFTRVAWAFLLLAGAGAVYLLAPGWPGRWLGLFMFLPALLPYQSGVPAGAIRMVVLDVGQGLAVIVETANKTLVYDPGPRYASGSDAGTRTVIPYLASRGRRQVDMIIVSHADSDHSGGLGSLRKQFPETPILAGGGDRQPANTSACRRGQHWRWDGVEFRILHPDSPGWQGNDASCVLLIKNAGRSVLLTGDIQRPAEQYLQSSVPRVDVALVSHHGSSTSSTEAWVRAVCPEIALVSAGYRNRWGFPRPEVIRRWRSIGAALIDTGQSGAVTLLIPSGSDAIEIKKARADSLPVWRIGEDIPVFPNRENTGVEVSGFAPGAVSCREFDHR